MTPEEFERKNKEEAATLTQNIHAADKAAAQTIVEPKMHSAGSDKKDEHTGKKTRKLMVPIKWSK